MSVERTVTNVTKDGTSTAVANAEVRAESRNERKARLAQVLDRGIVMDRLAVDLPPDIVGHWCRNDPLDIDRAKTLGYTIDNTYAPRRSIHNDGSNSGIVGDVIHMVTSRENYELIEEIRMDQFKRLNDKKDSREDKDFAEQTNRTVGNAGVHAIAESKTHSVNAAEILSQISTTTK